jgi:hypothetical protein
MFMDIATKQEFREIIREEVTQVVREEIKPVTDRIDGLEDVMHAGFSELESDINRRFEFVDQRFDRMDQRFERMDQRFERMDQRFDRVEKIIDKWPAPSTVDRLLERTGLIEKHIGIRSV